MLMPRKPNMFSSLRMITLILHLSLSLLLQLAGQATCHPTLILRAPPNELDRPLNQTSMIGPETVQTEQNITLNSGQVVIERCDIAFIPVSTHDGVFVQAVKNCTLEPIGAPSGASAGSCGITPTSTVTITSVSAGVPPNFTVTSAAPITTNASIATAIPSNNVSITVETTPTVTAASASETLSLSLSPQSTNSFPQQTSALPNSVSTTASPSSSSLAPQSELSSSATSTTTMTSMSSPASNVASAPSARTSVLPKVIGAFAGVAVLLLIIGGTVGYLKMKKLNNKDESEEPIRWGPVR